jgi:hypothetical protein
MANSQFGQPLTRYVNETQTDFIGARNSVNGGQGLPNRELVAGYAPQWLTDPLLATRRRPLAPHTCSSSGNGLRSTTT